MNEVFIKKRVGIEKEMLVGFIINTIIQAVNFRAYLSRGQYSLIAFHWSVSVVILIMLVVSWKMVSVKKKFVVISIIF